MDGGGWLVEGDHLEAQLERECKHLREQKEKQHLEWKSSNQQHKQMVQVEYDKKVCLFKNSHSLVLLWTLDVVW